MFTRMRIGLAAVAAFLVGIPLTQKASAQVFDLIDAGIDFGFAIADLSEGS